MIDKLIAKLLAKMDKSPLFAMSSIVAAVVAMVFVPVLIGYTMTLYLGVPITIAVDARPVYQGNSACVDIVSGGDTTQVKIRGGFLCLFPRAVFVGRNITVQGDTR